MVNSAIFTIVFACIIAIIVIAINSKMDNTEIASEEKAEKMQKQEEQSTPKALTEITAREPNTNNFTYVTSEDGIQVPVPKGYVSSTDAEERYVNGVTIDGVREHHGGFVIYEKNAGETDEQATEDIETDLDTAQRERNQWVWVPISSEEVSNMYHVTNGQIYGNYYNSYSIDSTPISSGKLEPLVLEPSIPDGIRNHMSDYDHLYLKQLMNGISRGEFLQEMRYKFYEMLVSVKTYGGFYIGRYETGNTNEKIPVVVQGNNKTSEASTWYEIYKQSKNIGNKNYKTTETGLIWGIQWDETIKWLVESGDKTTQQLENASSWGNMSGGKIYSTGSNENWCANNIYDLAGNCIEWTMESRYFAGNTQNEQECTRILRGGASCYNNFLSKYPMNVNGGAPSLLQKFRGYRTYLILVSD